MDIENITISLIKIIGSPFQSISKKHISLSHDQIKLLYNHAFKNRVELLFLQRIKSSKLAYEMETLYKDLINRCNLTKSVAIKTSIILQNANVPHVIFKSIKPYPATPNDTDVLCFNPKKNYEKGLEALLKKGFLKLGEAPLQICLSDPRGKGKVNLTKEGGTYYVDYYREVATDYIVYIDQNSLLPYVTQERIDGENIYLLAQEPELAIVLFHNVFPERTFHLEHFYLCLYRFADSSFLFNRFKIFIEKNRMVSPIKANLSIIANLHKVAFGTIPEPILDLLEYWGEGKQEGKRLREKNHFVPYNFSPTLFWKTFIKKLRDLRTFKSLVTQIFKMMINPKFFIEAVVSVIKRTFYKDIYLHR